MPKALIKCYYGYKKSILTIFCFVIYLQLLQRRIDISLICMTSFCFLDFCCCSRTKQKTNLYNLFLDAIPIPCCEFMHRAWGVDDNGHEQTTNAFVLLYLYSSWVAKLVRFFCISFYYQHTNAKQKKKK